MLKYQLQNVVVAGLKAAHVCKPHVHYQHVGYRAGKYANFLLNRGFVVENALAGVRPFTVVNAKRLLLNLC